MVASVSPSFSYSPSIDFSYSTNNQLNSQFQSAISQPTNFSTSPILYGQGQFDTSQSGSSGATVGFTPSGQLASLGGYGTSAPQFNNILGRAFGGASNASAPLPNLTTLANFSAPAKSAPAGAGSGTTFSFTPLSAMQGSVFGNLSGANAGGSPSFFSSNLSSNLFSSMGSSGLGGGFTPLSTSGGLFSRSMTSPALSMTPFTSMFGTRGGTLLAGNPSSGGSGISVLYKDVVVNNGTGFVNVVKNNKTGEYGVQTSKGIDWNNKSIVNDIRLMDFQLKVGPRDPQAAGTAKDIYPTAQQYRDQQTKKLLLNRDLSQAGVLHTLPAPFSNNQIQNAFPLK
jgi:hypothetical protein